MWDYLQPSMQKILHHSPWLQSDKVSCWVGSLLSSSKLSDDIFMVRQKTTWWKIRMRIWVTQKCVDLCSLWSFVIWHPKLSDGEKQTWNGSKLENVSAVKIQTWMCCCFRRMNIYWFTVQSKPVDCWILLNVNYVSLCSLFV